jgi:Tfp pilus assembly protein PilF
MASTRPHRFAGILSALLFVCISQVCAQTKGKNVASAVEGVVQDAQKHPVPAVVLLEDAEHGNTLIFTAGAQGEFRFSSVLAGSYILHAKLLGYVECVEGPFALREHETKTVVLTLTKDFSAALAFSDEPAFTVAGVTDTTALGGHGSGPIVRNSNALSKETVSLGREKTESDDNVKQESAIRATLSREDTAELHEQLADIEEREGRPLEAVKEYQRAAEMQPTEANLFAWGAELLLHHAPEPAIEVFAKGHRLYPHSSRMMLGLGAAWYAQRSTEHAMQTFLEACDLNPSDPTPYLFLGRLQATEQVVPSGWIDRMKRFVTLHPENAEAHYLYAVALMKQGNHSSAVDVAEAELNTAIKLDPKFGDAYLQLGILHLERQDFSGAINALESAVELTPAAEEAHYRLAQVYRRLGETENANQEIAMFKKISEQRDAETEKERHEIPQFVYTLRNQNSLSQPTSQEPH